MNKSKHEKIKANDLKNERKSMIGQGMSFAAAEAYKLLRTNIMFSFTDEGNEGAKTIGITSSVSGEGKSLVSLNLAHYLAEMGKNVMLLECDLRLPTFAKRLRLSFSPGLCNILTGIDADGLQVVQQSTLCKGPSIIVAGDTPPNPSELLGSNRMKRLLSGLKERYDYILLDLPPIGAVTDALVVSNIVDGMIVVVRHGYSDRDNLASTMRQLEYVNAKVLGFVYNASDEKAAAYKRYGGRKKYGGYYYEQG